MVVYEGTGPLRPPTQQPWGTAIPAPQPIILGVPHSLLQDALGREIKGSDTPTRVGDPVTEYLPGGILIIVHGVAIPPEDCIHALQGFWYTSANMFVYTCGFIHWFTHSLTLSHTRSSTRSLMHPFIRDVMRKDEKMQQSPEGPPHNVTMQCAGYMLVQIINNESAATGVQCSVMSEGAVAVL